jgi:type VI secretion system protein ImpG
MDPRLLDYYNRELAYVREHGAEFAEQFPKVASRLGMRGIEVADPYVERLLEGFAFMSARIQLKMDAEFPRFSQRLLDLIYPGYLSPTPAMAVAHIEPSQSEGGSPEGFHLARDARMRARLPTHEQTACEFRTAHAVTLWPLKLVEAKLTGAPPDLPIASYKWGAPVRGALRLTFDTTGQVDVSALKLDSLPIFLAGVPEYASKLQELIHTQALGVAVHRGTLPTRDLTVLPAEALSPDGFASEQAILPVHSRAFDGYRLLHEYFAFPDRFRFFSLNGLQQALRRLSGSRFEVVILLRTSNVTLESVVDAGMFALHCVPVVNLFPRTSDRIPVTTNRFEYHAVIDRTRPLDFEIHSITKVTGHRADSDREIVFQPFYAAADTDRRGWGAFFSVRREPRLLSDRARNHGPRTGYIGSECFLSLVDVNEAPFSDDLRQLTVEALCTNRDLSLLTPIGNAQTDLTLMTSAPVQSIRFVAGPSRPVPGLAEREITWRLISHLSLNYLTLTDSSADEGAAALRELLGLYARLGGPAASSQIDSVQKLKVSRVDRRVPGRGPIVFGRGVNLDLELDELPLSGTSPWALGAVLEQFFARHASINTFTELALRSNQRGHIASWPARLGRRPTV